MAHWIGSLPHVTWLTLNGGKITIGPVEPRDGVAVAADAAKVLATFQRSAVYAQRIYDGTRVRVHKLTVCPIFLRSAP
jgi:hypothetical protein